MAQPPAYTRAKDFTEDFGSETDHSSINAELDAAANSINDIRYNIALLQADDGLLRPEVVTADSLSDALREALVAEVEEDAAYMLGQANTASIAAVAAAATATTKASEAVISAGEAAASAAAATSEVGVITASLAAANGASLVGTNPTGGLAATNVQDALDELDEEKVSIAGLAADGGSGLINFGPNNLGHYASLLYSGVGVAIDCFGDSTMYGDDGGTGVQAATTQPSRLQFFLRAYYGNGSATVNNVAISGTDTQQMLDGTDGSGATFLARIAATSASIIYCNHCINDVNVGRTAIEFKANWIEIIDICRRYGKSPVIVTPAPMLVVGNVTFDVNAEKIRKFVEVMQQVAKEYSVPIVDQYDLVNRYFRSGELKSTVLMPDGEHPSEALYKQMGNNLAIPFVANCALPDFEGFLPASMPHFQSTGTNGSKAINLPYSRVGNGRWTDATGTQTIRLAIFIPETGCDLYLAQMLWDQGAALGNISVDFASVGNLSWYQNQPFASAFSNDYEVAIARNVAPGLHYVECTNNGAGKLGINYLRVRETIQPKTIKGTGATTTALPTLTRNVKMLDKITIQPQSAGDSSVVLFDELPSRGLFEEHIVEVDATLADSQFIVMRGCVNSSMHTISGSANPFPHVAVGLDGSGFLTCYEFTPSFTRATNFDGVDHSGVAGIYRFEIFAGTLKVYLNGAQVGSTLTLLEPDLVGGTVGVYTFNTSALVTINSISYVYNR